MKLVILCATVLLASSGAASVYKHSFKILNNIDNQIEKHALSNPKHSRNFAMLTHRPNQTVYYKSGDPASLVCEGIGAPAPNIRWFKNNIPIYEHDLESNQISLSSPTSIGRVTSTLVITHARDGDEIACVVTAKAKSARATTVIFNEDGVSEKRNQIKLIPREPHILTSYKMYIDVVGSTVVLPCKARGLPRPRVVWTNHKGIVIKNDERIKVLRSGKLVLSSLKWSDMGQYTCEATNEFGSQRVTTFVYPAAAE